MPKHGEVQKMFPIVPIKVALDKANEFKNKAQGTTAPISGTVSTLATIAGAIPGVNVGVGLTGLVSSVYGMLINSQRDFYNRIFNVYFDAYYAAVNSGATHVMFEYPLTFLADGYYPGQGMAPVTSGKWIPNDLYVDYVAKGSESSLRSIARNTYSATGTI